MPHHRLPIDRDELELALTWPAEESGCWLDLTSGEVGRFGDCILLSHMISIDCG